jgi:hypothetical protein
MFLLFYDLKIYFGALSMEPSYTPQLKKTREELRPVFGRTRRKVASPVEWLPQPSYLFQRPVTDRGHAVSNYVFFDLPFLSCLNRMLRQGCIFIPFKQDLCPRLRCTGCCKMKKRGVKKADSRFQEAAEGTKKSDPSDPAVGKNRGILPGA